jgi:hypothetical protein
MEIMPKARESVVAMVFAIGILQSGCTSSPIPSLVLTRPAETLRQSGTLTNKPPVARLICPTLGASRVPATLQAQGGHIVILSWRASAADSKHSTAVGYCLYRATNRKVLPTELVNSLVFPGTSCIDDLVANGQKYYYVVRAISAAGVPSIPSNVAPAPISTGKQSNLYASEASAPLCREPVSVK